MPFHQSPNHSSQQETEPFSHSGDTVPVFATDDEQEALFCSLVLSSAGITHHCSRTGENLLLTVAAEDAVRADAELRAYFKENENWPPPAVAPEETFRPMLQPPTLLLVGSLILFYTVTGPWSKHSIWFSRGAGDAESILNAGEYYRLITALTLHADTVHLLGNCLFGGFLFHFFCKLTGNGLGLFSMLITATLANYINVVLHGGNHLFVGFSTAVFAVIGMLAMISGTMRTDKRYLRILPFMAGAALLAMIGSSGERTDLGAHFFGLCCGLAWGWLLNRPSLLKIRDSFAAQAILFILAVAVTGTAWKLALA